MSRLNLTEVENHLKIPPNIEIYGFHHSQFPRYVLRAINHKWNIWAQGYSYEYNENSWQLRHLFQELINCALRPGFNLIILKHIEYHNQYNGIILCGQHILNNLHNIKNGILSCGKYNLAVLPTDFKEVDKIKIIFPSKIFEFDI